MKRILLIFIPALVIFNGCGRFANEEKKQEHKERIVSISKQYTEIIYALGAEQDLVAVDVSSTYPPEAKKLPTVGYHRALSIESMLAAKPTIILRGGKRNIGPEHVASQLEQLKIPMKDFDSKSNDIEGAKNLIREMGAYFHKEKRADSLCEKLDADMKTALENAAQYKNNVPKVLIIHFGRAANIYMVISQMGAAGKMIEWAGGTMAVNDTSRMKQISAEIVSKSDPDVILLTDFGYDKLGSVEKIKELPGVSSTRAAKSNRIFRIEEHDIIYLGPRTGENTLMLQKLIHSDAPAN
jgi:iron complex transport system substrate-binding protein